jgi:hypothetical protein
MVQRADRRYPCGCLVVAFSPAHWGCSVAGFQWGSACKVPNLAGRMTWRGMQGIEPQFYWLGVHRGPSILGMGFSTPIRVRALWLGRP